MKRLTIFFISTIVLAFGSCSELEQINQEQGSIAAVMEGTDTRTSVTDEGTFTWSKDDKIWLQTTNGNVVGTLSNGEGTPNANFSYGAIIGGGLTGKAIYPYNSGHSADDNAVAVVLPASYELDSFLQNTNAAMYGVNANGTVKFNHLAGVMRFSFKDVPAGVDRFRITLDKKINGTFKADLTADYPVLETAVTNIEAEKTVELNFDALTETSDINLYVPLPLGTYTTLGLALFKGEVSVWTYSNTVTNTVNRKSLILMPTVTLDGSIGGGGETPSEPQEGDYIDEYGINHGQGIEIDGVVWAPVNCGYHKNDFKYGKLYQWGRKYGQGYSGSFYADGRYVGNYSDATIPEIVSAPVSLSIGQLQANMNKYYYNSNDWCSPGDENLWNSGTESEPVKTEYDPCPDGWRVPTYAELEKLIKNYSSLATDKSGQSGYWISGTESYSPSVPSVFLPAAGLIYIYDGDGRMRGDHGHYWSSRAIGGSDSGSARHISFRGYYTNEYYGEARAFGYSVRCVKDKSTSNVPAEPETMNLS